MNHIYRLIWSDAQRTWVVASEATPSRNKRSSKAVGSALRSTALAIGLSSAVAMAAPPAPGTLPIGAQVVAGQASIAQSGATLNVVQSTDKAVVNWQSFNIGSGAAVNFSQPHAGSVSLNRVLGSDPSSIFGSLSANGQVFLVNPNGVLFGASARVDVGGLVASTLSLSNEDFLGGSYRFSRDGATGSVINQGALIGSYAALLAPEVRNEGVIVAPMGTVALAAGEAVTLGIAGHRLIDVQVERATVNALVENRNLVQVDGGTAILSAQSAQTLLGKVVNTGAIEANGIDASGGTIRLAASHGLELGGRIVADAGVNGNGGTVLAIADLSNKVSRTEVTGALSARGGADGGNGGFIETSGSQLKISNGARIDTSAAKGAFGQWLLDPVDFTIAAVGGDLTGSALSSALNTTDITIRTTDTSASCVPLSCGSGDAGNGDIFVNDAVSWTSGRTLTLSAWRDVRINAPINVGGPGKLALAFGQSGGEFDFPAGDYFVNAPVTLAVGAGFSTQIANDTLAVNHTVIHDAAGLAAVAGDLSGSYVLGNDVAAPVGSWTPLGDAGTPFAGSFDGLGHVVSGLKHTNAGADANVGLFGYSFGLIQNVGVVGADVDGSQNVGALVGYNNGFVVNSYATGTVKGSGATVGAIGGLIGYSQGPIQQSYADVTVSAPGGDQSSGHPMTNSVGGIGGLAGVVASAVTDSYARGSVQGVNAVGGLVGYSAAAISASYSTAAVNGTSNVGGLVGQVFDPGAFTPFIFDSYWDTTTSGQVNGGGGAADVVVGLGSAAMKSPSTFSSWDGNVWERRDGQYPMLKQMLKPIFAVADDKTAVYSGSAFSAFTGAISPGAVVGSLSFTPSSADPTNAGSYTITPGGISVADAANQSGYRIEFVPGTLRIDPAALTVTANNASKTYDGNAYSGGAGVNYAGFVNGETASVLGGTLRYGGSSQGAVNAGSYAIAPQGLTSVNYTLSFIDGALTIDPALLTAITGSLVGTVSKTYNGTSDVTGLTAANFSLAGWQGGDAATVTKTTGTFTDGPNASVSTARPVTVSLATGDFSPVGSTDLSNYTLPTSVSGNIGEISKRPITGSLVGSISKVYDGSTTATVDVPNVSLTNFVAGEGVSLVGDAWKSGGFLDRNVGSGKLVGIGLSPADLAPTGATNLSNYSLPSLVVGPIGTISARNVTLIAPVVSKTYDGTVDHVTTGTELASFTSQLGVAGDSVTSASMAFVDKHAGAGNKGFGFAGVSIDDGNGGLNYNITLTGNSVSTITPKLITGALSSSVNKIYDGNASAIVSFQDMQLSGFVAGEEMAPFDQFDEATLSFIGSFDSKDAGARTVALNTSGWSAIADRSTALLGNYTLPSSITGGTGEIFRRTITSSLVGSIAKTYDGNALAAIGASNLSLTNFVAGEGAALVGEAWKVGAFDNKNAGSGKMVSAGFSSADYAAVGTTNLDNYVLPNVASGPIGTIAPRGVTFSAPQASKVYDGTTAVPGAVALQPLTDALGVAGDRVSAIGLAFTDKNAGEGNKTVRYSGAVIDDGNGGSNYSVSYADNLTGTIARKDVTVSLSGTVTKVYDGKTDALIALGNLQTTGFLPGEEMLPGNQLIASGLLGAFDSKDAGLHDVTLAMSGWTGALGLPGNYNLPSSVTGTGEIQRRPITGSLVGSVDKVYDGNTNAAVNFFNYSFNVSNYVAGEGAYLAGTNSWQTGTFASKDVGSGQLVTVEINPADYKPVGSTKLSNYSFPSVVSGNIGTINKATLTYTADPQKGVFQELTAPFTGTVTGFVNGESQASATTGKVSWATPATASSPVGSYVINGDGLEARNYEFAQAADNATALTIITQAQSKARNLAEVIGQAVNILKFFGRSEKDLTEKEQKEMLQAVAAYQQAMDMTKGLSARESKVMWDMGATKGASDEANRLKGAAQDEVTRAETTLAKNKSALDAAKKALDQAGSDDEKNAATLALRKAQRDLDGSQWDLDKKRADLSTKTAEAELAAKASKDSQDAAAKSFADAEFRNAQKPFDDVKNAEQQLLDATKAVQDTQPGLDAAKKASETSDAEADKAKEALDKAAADLKTAKEKVGVTQFFAALGAGQAAADKKTADEAAKRADPNGEYIKTYAQRAATLAKLESIQQLVRNVAYDRQSAGGTESSPGATKMLLEKLSAALKNGETADLTGLNNVLSQVQAEAQQVLAPKPDYDRYLSGEGGRKSELRSYLDSSFYLQVALKDENLQKVGSDAAANAAQNSKATAERLATEAADAATKAGAASKFAQDLAALAAAARATADADIAAAQKVEKDAKDSLDKANAKRKADKDAYEAFQRAKQEAWEKEQRAKDAAIAAKKAADADASARLKKAKDEADRLANPPLTAAQQKQNVLTNARNELALWTKGVESQRARVQQAQEDLAQAKKDTERFKTDKTKYEAEARDKTAALPGLQAAAKADRATYDGLMSTWNTGKAALDKLQTQFDDLNDAQYNAGVAKVAADAAVTRAENHLESLGFKLEGSDMITLGISIVGNIINSTKVDEAKKALVDAQAAAEAADAKYTNLNGQAKAKAAEADKAQAALNATLPALDAATAKANASALRAAQTELDIVTAKKNVDIMASNAKNADEYIQDQSAALPEMQKQLSVNEAELPVKQARVNKAEADLNG